MSIKNKILVTFLSLAVIAALSVTAFNFFCSKNVLLRMTVKQLEILADLKSNKIETFFDNLKDDIIIAQDYYNIKLNLPVVSQFSKNRNHPDFIKAKEMLDGQLRKWLKIKEEVHDIMLVNPEGKIVYSANKKHLDMDLNKFLPDSGGKTFAESKKRIFVGPVFKSPNDKFGYEFGMLVAAPILDFEKQFVGIVAFEINMDFVYKYVQNITSLGKTGETVLVQKRGNDVVFLNPLLHDPNSALEKVVRLGNSMAIPAQEAAIGKNGSGVVRDYRNEDVLAVWRYMANLDWGIVTKMDLKEVLAPAVALRNLVLTSCAIVCVLIFVASLMIAESISKPIRVLHRETEIIAGGNFGHRVRMDRQDEIGQLSRAFDNMSEYLQTSTISIGKLNQEIAWHKKTQDALQKSEVQLAITLGSIGDAVIATDTKGHITFINPVCENLTGWKKEDAVGKSLIEIFNVVNGNTDMPEGNPVERVLKENVIVELTDNTVLIAKDGTRYPIDDSASPIRDKEGGIIGIVLVFHDITERKKKEEELKKATAIKSKFASMVAHELRSPLTVIKESIGLILEGVAGDINDKQRKFLDMANDNSERLARLINDVLDFQKIESGKMEYNIRENNISDVVLEVQKSMAILANEKGLDITANLDEHLPQIKFDRDKVIQVLTNLADNAIKFTEKGAVSITAQQQDNTVHIMVRDTGPGIKTEDLPKLFQTFEQLDSTNCHKKEGTGLGLAISKEIILFHKGKIWAESQFGEGSTFHFTLPL